MAGTIPTPPTIPEQVSTGQVVRNAQALLLAHGDDPGGIDGTFGPKTEAAIRKFQGEHKLGVDGSIGQNTWTALFQ